VLRNQGIRGKPGSRRPVLSPRASTLAT
jgi:hypothetical protein